MLTAIRDTTTGWVAKFIVGLLAVCFVLWGVGASTGRGSALEVARVNGQGISLEAWRNAYSRLRPQTQQSLGRALSEDDEGFIKDQALWGMISAELVDQIVAQEKLQISDRALRKAITELEVFQEEGGGFDRARYERGVLSQGLPPAAFEHELRQDMLSEQLENALLDSAFVLDSEVEQLIGMRDQRRDIRYVTLAADSFLDQVPDDEDEISQWYQSNLSAYMEPERVRVAYLELRVDDLLDEVEVQEEDLLRHYEDHRDEYDKGETRSVHQLIARFPEQDATPEMKEKARERIEKVQARVKKNPKQGFDSLVKALQKEDQADIDFVDQPELSKGALPAAIDEFVFAAKKGDVSEVMEAPGGLHIVKLLDIQEKQDSLDAHRDKVEKGYRRAEAEKIFVDRADRLINASYEHPDALEVAALESGAPIQESEFFSSAGASDGIASYPDVVLAAFSEKVKELGKNSELIELSATHWVVLRVVEQQAERAQSMEEVREQLTEDFAAERASELAKQRGESILDALRGEKDMESVAQEYEIEWVEREGVDRNDAEMSRYILRSAFQAGRPEEGEVLYQGAQSGAGDYSVVAVSAVENAQLDEIDAQRKDRAHKEILDHVGASEWRFFLWDARLQAEVDVYKENM